MEHAQIIIYATGGIGIVLWLVVLYYFFCRAVLRDQFLNRGIFTITIVLLSILTPSTITSGLLLANNFKFFEPQEIWDKEDDGKPTNQEQNLDTITTDESSNSITAKYTNLYWSVYYHFVDPGNQHSATSDRGRWIVSIISILGIILLNGLLITTLINWFQQRQEQWRKGELRYNNGSILKLNKDCRLKNYSIIIGGNKITSTIISQIASDSNYIIILTQRNADEYRRELFSALPPNIHHKIIIYCGDCTSEEEISNLQLQHAKEIYIIGECIDESNNNSYHDTINMKCFTLIHKYYSESKAGEKICTEISNKEEEINNIKSAIKANEANDAVPKVQIENLREKKKTLENELTSIRNQRIMCRVMFEHQTTFSIYQFSDLSKKIDKYINFKPFNYYETWAQKVLINNNLNLTNSETYLPLEGRRAITTDSPDFVHLIIIGMSRMGYAMAIEAAHLAHYPNFIENKKCSRITFIDSNARQEMSFFTNRFKELFAVSRHRYVEAEHSDTIQQSPIQKLYSNTQGWFNPLTDPNSQSPYKGTYLGENFIDVEWEFIQGDIQWCEVQQYLKDAVNEPNSRVTIAVCQPNNNDAVAAALYLDTEAIEKAQQVLVYQRNDSSIINSINSGNSPYNQLKAFGMEDNCYDIGFINRQERLAKIFAEKYDEMYSKIQTNNPDFSKLDDAYGKSNTAKMWSNLYNANTIWSKLRSVGYQGLPNENINQHQDKLKIVEHNRWNIEQLLLRFRPLLEQEQKEITDLKDKPIEFMLLKEKKKRKMAHLNICSWDVLATIDGDSCIYDEKLTEVLPKCYKSTLNN